MPIRLNLLAEAQAAEEARRRDPVKLAIRISAILIFFVLLWSGFLFWKVRAAQQDLQTQEGYWKKDEKNFELVVSRQKEMLDIESKLSALTRLSTNRFLWGSVLNGLQQAAAEKKDN